MGTEFLGPGAGQGFLEALALALSAPGGMGNVTKTSPAADVPVPFALGVLVNKTFTIPAIPASLWGFIAWCMFRIDATLADMVVMQLDVDGLFNTEWDAAVGAGSTTCGLLITGLSFSSGGGHSCTLRGQSAVGGGNCVLKRLSGGGVLVTQLQTLLLPSRQV